MNFKKIFLIVAVIVLCLSFGISASAERKYMEAAVVSPDNVVYSFDVYDMETLYGEYKNRVYFSMDCDNYQQKLSMRCFDKSGMPLSTIEFYPADEYVDVPDCTAMVEIFYPNSTVYDTYFYNDRMNVYSYDGRAKGIYTLQAPVYKMVGWYMPVTVYAEDWRELEISPFKVKDFQKVGWYTYEELLYKEFKVTYNELKERKEYASIINMVGAYLYSLEGTPYASKLYSARTEAMDLWRSEVDAPIGIGYNYVTEGEKSYDENQAVIEVFNISYKPIIALELSFTCYDVWGEEIYTGYEYYHVNDTYISPCKSEAFCWEIGYGDAEYISDIRVEKVVYDDYSRWPK